MATYPPAQATHPSGPRLVLLRHGETEWSRTGKHTGRTDIPLTDTGREQARNAGERLRDFDIREVYASPLSRAWETAELALSAAGLDVPVHSEPDLVEWDYGDDEGLTTPEIQQERPGWTVFSQGPKNGETAEQVGARLDRVLARATGQIVSPQAAAATAVDARDGGPGPAAPRTLSHRSAAPDPDRDASPGDVLLVAHGHSLRVLTARWLGLPPTEGRLFHLQTGTVSLLGYEHGLRIMLAWNLD
ncbi:MAG: histidine phosphatase family protein [Actinomycetes bacterium]